MKVRKRGIDKREEKGRDESEEKGTRKGSKEKIHNN